MAYRPIPQHTTLRPIYEVEHYLDSDLQESSSVSYYQLSGATAVNFSDSGVESIMIANTHATLDAVLNLYVIRTTAPTSIYILKDVAIPINTALLLDKEYVRVESAGATYRAQLTVASGTPTADIIVKL
jgi:hypothetical protein